MTTVQRAAALLLASLRAGTSSAHGGSAVLATYAYAKYDRAAALQPLADALAVVGAWSEAAGAARLVPPDAAAYDALTADFATPEAAKAALDALLGGASGPSAPAASR